MAEDIQYPQDTLSGGSVVQSALTPNGERWTYDNEAKKWVNLKTGEQSKIPPADEYAGMNAAERTHALAYEMRKAEAEIAAGTYKPVTPTPQQRAVFQPEANRRWMQDGAQSTRPPFPGAGFVPPYMATQPPAAAPTAIAPPDNQTGTNPPPMAAPITPPQDSGMQQPIAPPTIDPAYRQRLMDQRSVPGTRTPPSPASIQSYNLQMYQRAVAQGMPQKQAAQLYLGAMLAAQGQAKPMTDFQKAQVQRWNQPKVTTPIQDIQTKQAQQRLDQSKEDSQRKAEASKRALSPEAKERVKLMEQDRASIIKRMQGDGDPKSIPGYEMQLQTIGQMIQDEYRKAGTATVSPPSGSPAAKPSAKMPTRKLAREYVDKYGKDAKAKLKADGFDLSGYAD